MEAVPVAFYVYTFLSHMGRGYGEEEITLLKYNI